MMFWTYGLSTHSLRQRVGGNIRLKLLYAPEMAEDQDAHKNLSETAGLL